MEKVTLELTPIQVLDVINALGHESHRYFDLGDHFTSDDLWKIRDYICKQYDTLVRHE